jgi:DNA-binding NtrC family response regulator
LVDSTKILVIDDEESIRTTLSLILSEEGYLVDTAENAKEALEKTSASFYNVVLSDIRLPDMEGTKLLAMIKDTMPRMRKMIMTGYPSLQNAIESVNFGADAYILKPFEMEDVLKQIKTQLKKQQDELNYSQDKVAQFIETQFKQITANEK